MTFNEAHVFLEEQKFLDFELTEKKASEIWAHVTGDRFVAPMIHKDNEKVLLASHTAMFPCDGTVL